MFYNDYWFQVRGVKGRSFIWDIKHGDPVNGVAIDWLHGALLGEMKKLYKYWFADEFNTKDFFIGHRLNEVNTRHLDKTPPDEITRTPRCMERYLKDYKGITECTFEQNAFFMWYCYVSHFGIRFQASQCQHCCYSAMMIVLNNVCIYSISASEFKTDLFYYDVIDLQGILPDEYYLHYCLLRAGLYILAGNQISENDMVLAKDMLLSYYRQLSVLYGKCILIHYRYASTLL